MSFSASKTPGSILAEILMLKTTHSGGFFLVEGDDDSLFWSPRVIEQACQLVIAGGKPNVIGTANLLDQHADRTVIGYVDADFDRATGVALASPRLSRTDTHDLETMMISTDALRKVLTEIANPLKISSFEQSCGKSVFDALVDRSTPFGQLRLLNELRDYRVSFDALSPHRFFDPNTWQLDTVRLHSEFSALASIQPHLLQPSLSALPNLAPLDLMQGHDALAILSIGLKRVLGGRMSYSARELASRLRLATESQHFSGTQLMADLRSCENRHGIQLLAI